MAPPLVEAVDLAHPVVSSGGVDTEQEGESPIQRGILTVWVLVTQPVTSHEDWLETEAMAMAGMSIINVVLGLPLSGFK